MTQVQVRDEPDRSRFVAEIDGEQVGESDYTLEGDVITFTHTEVDPERQGQGIAGALLHQSLDDVRRRGLRVVPQCPFYAAWFDKHPEAADLLVLSHP